MSENNSKVREIIQKAEDYLKKFDEGLLVTTDAGNKIKIKTTDEMTGETVYRLFADVLGEKITIYRLCRSSKDNTLVLGAAKDLIEIFDKGIAGRIIVAGEGVFKRIKELEETIQKLSEELETLRKENENLKEEIERLRRGREDLIPP